MADGAPTVLDPCCGTRMFWFNRQDDRAVFGDVRSETVTVTDRSHHEDGTRTLTVSPDQLMDFRAMPFADGSFKLVVFDPPHLVRAGADSWLRAKYGVLDLATWRDDLRAGFAECFRVLVPHGVLIFKWNETQIKVSEILALTPEQPLFGHPSGKRAATHWICFMKAAPAQPTGADQ